MEQIGQARQRAMRRRVRRRRRGEEREARRRRVGGKRAHRVEPADLERAEPLAQRRFERRLPAGLDADPRPEARERVEAVARQPGLELVLDLHLLLQRLERSQTRAELGVLARFLVDQLLQSAALLVERRDARLPVGHHGERGLVLRLGLVGGALRRLELAGLDRDQRLLFADQPVAPRLGLRQPLVDAARLRRRDLDLLLHGGHGAALRVAARLRLAQRLFVRGETLVVGDELGADCFGAALCRFDLVTEPRVLSERVGFPRAPAGALRFEVGALAHQALAAGGDVADPLLEPAHLERGLGERALRRVQRVVGVVVRLADLFELGFGMAQVGALRFERGGRGDDRLADARLLARRVAVAQEPELVQLQLRVVLERAVASRDFGLRFELFEIAVELAQDVVDARQVLACVLEARLGLAPALLVLGDAGSLFEEEAQLLGLALDDPRDRPLADDRVGARPEPGAEEDVLDVAPAHRLAVDVVAAGAVARQHPLDGDLGEPIPRPPCARLAVVEHELDAGTAGRLSQVRAVEDHVLHRLAAQLARLALAEHPAHRVDDVGLAAAVRADDADELAGKLEVGRFDEGLEARELDRMKTHWAAADLPKCLI